MTELFPDLDFYLLRPLLEEPRLCDLRELEDGTYTILDLHMMHELLDFRIRNEETTQT